MRAGEVELQVTVVLDGPDDRAAARAVAELQGGAGIDEGLAGERVGPGQGLGPAGDVQAAAARDDAREGLGGRGQNQGVVSEDHLAGAGARKGRHRHVCGCAGDVESPVDLGIAGVGDGASPRQLQAGARADRGVSRESVGPAEGEGPLADGQAAASGYRAAEAGAVAVIELQRAIVGDVADDRSGGSTIAELEDAAGVDGGSVRIGVVGGEREGSAAGLGERAVVGQVEVLDGAGIGDVVGPIEHQRTAVHHGAIAPCAGCAPVADLDRRIS